MDRPSTSAAEALDIIQLPFDQLVPLWKVNYNENQKVIFRKLEWVVIRTCLVKWFLLENQKPSNQNNMKMTLLLRLPSIV